ncbi:MAG: PIN domain-containing protein [Gammaproteobacteria bacterium]|nr:MAG: PIN domain-containing protein [Gammaproteobacteria bacterium]
MRALFDVNVLIALLDADHVGHTVATSWFAAHLEHGWASCPITENGTARIMASAGYPNPLPVAAILQRLAVAKATEHHRFWPDDLSLTDTGVFRHAELLGTKQITDRYLLALAARNDGRLVTFDQGVRPTAVVGASGEHLVRLSG